MKLLRKVAVVLGGGAALLSAGCQTVGTCRNPLTDAVAQERGRLKMPVGLDGPDTSEAVTIPPLNEPELPHGRGDPCLEQPPPMKEPGSQSPPVRDDPAAPGAAPGQKRTRPVSPPR
jgi:hypothetical protein